MACCIARYLIPVSGLKLERKLYLMSFLEVTPKPSSGLQSDAYGFVGVKASSFCIFPDGKDDKLLGPPKPGEVAASKCHADRS